MEFLESIPDVAREGSVQKENSFSGGPGGRCHDSELGIKPERRYYTRKKRKKPHAKTDKRRSISLARVFHLLPPDNELRSGHVRSGV